jgi:hypothetical protein
MRFLLRRSRRGSRQGLVRRLVLPPVLGFFLLTLGLLVAGPTGCQKLGSGSGPAPAGDATAGAAQSEAARTKEMDEKARQMSERASEIQSSTGTEQEKIDAVNKLEQERQDLNKTGDGAAPPPPQQ